MERNFVTLHASVHPVHDVIMTGVRSLRFRQKKAAQVSAASTDTEGFALQRLPLGNDETRMCRGAIACTLTDARSASSGLHSPYLRHLPETKEKRPSRSDLWADGESILMGESPYSDCRQGTARHEMCRGAIACSLTDA